MNATKFSAYSTMTLGLVAGAYSLYVGFQDSELMPTLILGNLFCVTCVGLGQAILQFDHRLAKLESRDDDA